MEDALVKVCHGGGLLHRNLFADEPRSSMGALPLSCAFVKLWTLSRSVISGHLLLELAVDRVEVCLDGGRLQLQFDLDLLEKLPEDGAVDLVEICLRAAARPFAPLRAEP
eukprot:5138164-Pyramimonas_sp.AAC.1